MKLDDIVEEFMIKDRICLIRRLTLGSKIFHTGYVEVKYRTTSYDKYNMNVDLTEEATFMGQFDDYPNKIFLGFDSMHWNDNPSTQTHEAVKQRLMQWAENVIKFDEATNRFHGEDLKWLS